MAIERKFAPHEILIRLDENGGVRGAHVADIEGLYEDGVLIPGTLKECPPRPLTEAEVGALIGSEHARVLEAAMAGKVDLIAAKEHAAAVEGELADARKDSMRALIELSERKNQVIKNLWAEIVAIRQEKASEELRAMVERAIAETTPSAPASTEA